MTVRQIPSNGHSTGVGPHTPWETPLNSRVRGTSRMPGHDGVAFDLNAFSQALEQHNVGYQLARYAPGADIRIVDPENPPAAPRTLAGKAAIHAWMLDSITHDLELHVTHLVDGGDRVAFTEQSHYQDGTKALTTSTAELEHGLITTQHTILVWEQTW